MSNDSNRYQKCECQWTLQDWLDETRQCQRDLKIVSESTFVEAKIRERIVFAGEQWRRLFGEQASA